MRLLAFSLAIFAATSGELAARAEPPSSRRRIVLGSAVLGAAAGYKVPPSPHLAQDGRLVGLLITPEGAPLDPDGFVISTSAADGASQAIFDGRVHVVVWRSREGALDRVWAAQISLDGTVRDPGGHRC